MIKIMMDFINDVLLRQDAAVLAWVQFIPLALSLIQAGAGAIKEGKNRRDMQSQRNAWNAENEAWYNQEYYGDYTQRLDVQNTIRRMREEMDRQTKIDQGKQAVLGTTNEAVLAGMEQRNKAMSDTFSNIAAQGERYKENVQRDYRKRKFGLQGLEYDAMGEEAQSSNNLMYNGLSGLANADWASILGSYSKSAPVTTATPALSEPYSQNINPNAANAEKDAFIRSFA